VVCVPVKVTVPDVGPEKSAAFPWLARPILVTDQSTVASPLGLVRGERGGTHVALDFGGGRGGDREALRCRGREIEAAGGDAHKAVAAGVLDRPAD